MISERIKILLWGSNLWNLGEGMLGPLFAVFAQRIGGNVLDISWAWAIYLLTTGILIIFIGKISDTKIKKEDLMITGYVLNTLFTFSYLLVRSPIHLFFIQAGLGVAVAFAMPTWDALYSLSGNKQQKGYEWGLISGHTQIITGIAILIGGLIVNYFSFTVLFVTMGIIQIIATIYQAKILKKNSSPI